MTHVANSFAGKLFTGADPWVDVTENPQMSEDRSQREYVGDMIRRRMTKSVQCLKKDADYVRGRLGVDRTHLVLSAGANYDGTPATIDFGYGWRYEGLSSRSLSPSFIQLNFEFSRTLPMALCSGALTGLLFVENESSLQLKYNGVTLKEWAAEGPISAGLDFQGIVTRTAAGDATTPLTYFSAAGVLLFDNQRIEALTVTHTDFTSDPITEAAVEGSEPSLFNRLRKEVWWERDDEAHTITLMWWGKAWLVYPTESL